MKFMRMMFESLIVLLFLIFLIIPCFSVNPDSILSVHVIQMNHLDVGFDGIDPIQGFAKNVVNKYFNVYFPRAINISNALNQLGGEEKLIYTTHSYLISLYLDCPIGMGINCPTKQQQNIFIEAIKRGDIYFHAFPFNGELEWSDDSLVSYGFQMTQNIAAQLGVPTPRVMSQRDVPGATVGIIPIMKKFKIEAISFGANGASAPIGVPKIFKWALPGTNTSVIAMYHPGGYGGISLDDCVIVGDTALAFAFRGDNSGPPENVDEVLGNWKDLKSTFPNAKVMASTFDSFIDAISTSVDTLPLFDREMGDTWIHGVATDPYKLALERLVLRCRKDCLVSGLCDINDPLIANFSRLFVKSYEHTNGGDVKKFLDAYHQPWYSQWSNPQFNKVKSNDAFTSLMASWIEQRNWAVIYPIQALKDHPLKKIIDDQILALQPALPHPYKEGYAQVKDFTQMFTIGNFEISFSTNGAISHLLDFSTGEIWASESNQLGQFVYQTYDENDFDLFLSEYMYIDYLNSDWAYLDFGKVNLTKMANPTSSINLASLKSLFVLDIDVNSKSFLLKLALDSNLVLNYGAPADLWLRVDVNGLAKTINSDLQWFNKTSTRLPESLWLRFNTISDQILIDKLGTLVDATYLFINASHHIHGFDSGFIFNRKSSIGSHSLRVTSFDAGICDIGRSSPSAIPTPFTNPDLRFGASVNLFNNIWGTNFPEWYPYLEEDSNSKFRFQITFE